MSLGELCLHRFGDPQKPAVLWLHGWLGDGHEGEVLQSLLGEEIHLICPDLPGHGKTPLGDWDLELLMKSLADLSSQCEAAMGYSMGGRLLMMSAASHPLSFGPLVVESAHPGLLTPTERQERIEVDEERSRMLKNLGLSGFCRQWYQAAMWNGFLPPPRNGSPEELGESLIRFGLGRQPNLRSWLRTVQKPLLWLAGTRDPAYVLLADWCASATSHQVERVEAGHNIHLQQPREWARLVTHFLSKHQTF